VSTEVAALAEAADAATAVAALAAQRAAAAANAAAQADADDGVRFAFSQYPRCPSSGLEALFMFSRLPFRHCCAILSLT